MVISTGLRIGRLAANTFRRQNITRRCKICLFPRGVIAETHAYRTVAAGRGQSRQQVLQRRERRPIRLFVARFAPVDPISPAVEIEPRFCYSISAALVSFFTSFTTSTIF